MKWTKRLIIGFWCAILLLTVLGASPLWPGLRSLAVMEVSSAVGKRDSVMEAESFKLELPTMSGWYPKVCTFCDDENFSLYIGEPAKLTILYCFPAFDQAKGSSRGFDTESPLYSGFYGAYVVSLESGESYGFRQGERPETAASVVARYDYGNLVLRDLGLDWREQTFESTPVKVTEGLSCAGYVDWTRIDAELTANGLDHERKVFARSYLQYGAPVGQCQRPFATVRLRCATVAKYFPEYNAAVYLYAMTPSSEETERCVQELLRGTVIG